MFCESFKDWENKPINVFEQMDADEFFNLFLDKLESVTKDTTKGKIIKNHFGGIFANQVLFSPDVSIIIFFIGQKVR